MLTSLLTIDESVGERRGEKGLGSKRGGKGGRGGAGWNGGLGRTDETSVEFTISSRWNHHAGLASGCVSAAGTLYIYNPNTVAHRGRVSHAWMGHVWMSHTPGEPRDPPLLRNERKEPHTDTGSIL